MRLSRRGLILGGSAMLAGCASASATAPLTTTQTLSPVVPPQAGLPTIPDRLADAAAAGSARPRPQGADGARHDRAGHPSPPPAAARPDVSGRFQEVLGRRAAVRGRSGRRRGQGPAHLPRSRLRSGAHRLCPAVLQHAGFQHVLGRRLRHRRGQLGARSRGRTCCWTGWNIRTTGRASGPSSFTAPTTPTRTSWRAKASWAAATAVFSVAHTDLPALRERMGEGRLLFAAA